MLVGESTRPQLLPLFVERVTRLRGMHLVLDVEALRRWPGDLAGLLDALPLQRVIELRTRAVEPALAPLIAGCSNLRGITLALDDDVAALAGRIRRVRSMLRLSSMVEACVV